MSVMEYGYRLPYDSAANNPQNEEYGENVTQKDELIQTALDRVQIAEYRIMAFDWAARHLGRKMHTAQSEEVSRALAIVRSALYEDELDAYRNLFMWGNLFKEARQKAKPRALARFIKDGYSIMQYLNLDGEMPFSWLSEDEDNLRKLLTDAANVKEGDIPE